MAGVVVGKPVVMLQRLLLPRLSSPLPSPEIMDELLGLRVAYGDDKE